MAFVTSLVFFLQLRVLGSTMGTRPELEGLLRLLAATGVRPQLDEVVPLAQLGIDIGDTLVHVLPQSHQLVVDADGNQNEHHDDAEKYEFHGVDPPFALIRVRLHYRGAGGRAQG